MGTNLIETFLSLDAINGVLLNWDEMAALIVARLETGWIHLGGDPVLGDWQDRFSDRLFTASGDNARRTTTIGDAAIAIVPMRLLLEDKTLALFSRIAQFGSVQEVSMADIRIELFFPENQATKQHFERLYSKREASKPSSNRMNHGI